MSAGMPLQFVFGNPIALRRKKSKIGRKGKKMPKRRKRRSAASRKKMGKRHAPKKKIHRRKRRKNPELQVYTPAGKHISSEKYLGAGTLKKMRAKVHAARERMRDPGLTASERAGAKKTFEEASKIVSGFFRRAKSAKRAGATARKSGLKTKTFPDKEEKRIHGMAKKKRRKRKHAKKHAKKASPKKHRRKRKHTAPKKHRRRRRHHAKKAHAAPKKKTHKRRRHRKHAHKKAQAAPKARKRRRKHGRRKSRKSGKAHSKAMKLMSQLQSMRKTKKKGRGKKIRIGRKKFNIFRMNPFGGAGMAKIGAMVKDFTGRDVAEIGGIVGGAAGIEAIDNMFGAHLNSLPGINMLRTPTAPVALILGMIAHKYGKGKVKDIAAGVIAAAAVITTTDVVDLIVPQAPAVAAAPVAGFVGRLAGYGGISNADFSGINVNRGNFGQVDSNDASNEADIDGMEFSDGAAGSNMSASADGSDGTYDDGQGRTGDSNRVGRNSSGLYSDQIQEGAEDESGSMA